MMPPIAVLLLTDGRPGHYHRAEGILAAIARKRPVETARVDAQRRFWLPGRLLAALTHAGVAPARILKLAYGIDAGKLSRADLVVSSGGNTLAANIAAAKFLGARNIFYGGLRQFCPDDFSLILTSYGGHASRPRHRMTPLMPVPFDPERFPIVSAAGFSMDHPPRIAGLLIGGDAGTFRYRPSDWQRLLDFVTAMHTRYGTRWIISNSRRTPAEVSEWIARLAGDAAGPVSAFIDMRIAGAGTVSRLLAEAEAIVCTDDSSAMITEAVWLRRPAIGVAPAQCGFTEGEGWYRAHLAANGLTRTIPIAELSPQSALAAFAEIKPLAGNPLDDLAATIKDCLPELFTPRTEPG